MSDVHDLRSLLRSLCEETYGETVTVSDLLNAVGRRAYGPVLALLGLIAVSPLTLVPGANSLVALIILIFAVQMALGQPAPWIPRKLLKVQFPRRLMVKAVDAAEPYVGWVDWILRPRFTFLTHVPFVQVVALICVAAALITLPLSFIPLGPVIPSLAVLVLGLAITAQDGLMVGVGVVSMIAACALLMRVWEALPFG